MKVLRRSAESPETISRHENLLAKGMLPSLGVTWPSLLIRLGRWERQQDDRDLSGSRTHLASLPAIQCHVNTTHRCIPVHGPSETDA